MGRILRVKVGVGVRDVDGSCLRQKPPSRVIIQSSGWYGKGGTIQFSTCLFFFSQQIPSFQWNRKRCSSRWLCLGRLREVWWHLATAAYVPRLLGRRVTGFWRLLGWRTRVFSSWGVCWGKMISIRNIVWHRYTRKKNKRFSVAKDFLFKWLNFRICYLKVHLPKRKASPKKDQPIDLRCLVILMAQWCAKISP